MARETATDSGARHSEMREFASGAVKSSAEGKLQFSLIPTRALCRVALRYTEGADQYGDWNWYRGIPFTVLYDSALRHLLLWRLGRQDEDHLAAAVFNILALMQFESEDRKELVDFPDWEDGKSEEE